MVCPCSHQNIIIEKNGLSQACLSGGTSDFLGKWGTRFLLRKAGYNFCHTIVWTHLAYLPGWKTPSGLRSLPGVFMHVRGVMLFPELLSVLKVAVARNEASMVCVYCWRLMWGINDQVKVHWKHAHMYTEHVCISTQTCTHACMQTPHICAHTCTYHSLELNIRLMIYLQDVIAGKGFEIT